VKLSTTKSLRLISLMILLLLAACQGEKTIINNPAPVADTSMGGTDNTGGGSGIEGKPFEDYIEKNLELTDAYKNHLQALMDQIKIEAPGLAGDMYHISRNREWYFVPGPVRKISEQIIGAYSKSVQFALQDHNKVWIDRNLYVEMSPSSQANLLLHEMVIGIRLMQYQDKMDQCIAKAAKLALNEETAAEYKKQKQKCRRSYPRLPGFEQKKFRLNQNDYDIVRKIVSLLDRANPDIEEAVSIIESHGIRNYQD
jgi:hypothetical protein